MTGRAVIMTGGTSGVGLATACRLAADGDTRIALIGRNTERGKGACAAVRAVVPTCDIHFVAGDANDPAQAVAAATSARDLLGGVDALVNSTTAFYVPTLFREVPIWPRCTCARSSCPGSRSGAPARSSTWPPTPPRCRPPARS